MNKKEVDVPIVSDELGKAFQWVHREGSFSTKDILDPDLYVYEKTPEIENSGSDYLAYLLARMYTVGFEFDGKKYAIQFPYTDKGGTPWYLTRTWTGQYKCTTNLEEALITMKEINHDPGLFIFKKFAVEINDD
ncbi:hypothetical protein M8332_07085 (plasmid) [Fructilactobacillus ixorae]|uniref:Phage protein n=1 Tax=Fructilactobacillus ixorae TaxID=1750535 RepID=A0ABY5C5D4_9LACO|nr:hypothetical protein [Fructilactobacillus ixorae]USS93980.1 hypothetical protein M8332_07085 [Fructilactobacillus ixorae]